MGTFGIAVPKGLKPVPFKAMVLQFGWTNTGNFQGSGFEVWVGGCPYLSGHSTEREGTFNGATDGGNEVSESYGGFAGI
jgi:hypothetical protein